MTQLWVYCGLILLFPPSLNSSAEGYKKEFEMWLSENNITWVQDGVNEEMCWESPILYLYAQEKNITAKPFYARAYFVDSSKSRKEPANIKETFTNQNNAVVSLHGKESPCYSIISTTDEHKEMWALIATEKTTRLKENRLSDAPFVPRVLFYYQTILALIHFRKRGWSVSHFTLTDFLLCNDDIAQPILIAPNQLTLLDSQNDQMTSKHITGIISSIETDVRLTAPYERSNYEGSEKIKNIITNNSIIGDKFLHLELLRLKMEEFMRKEDLLRPHIKEAASQQLNKISPDEMPPGYKLKVEWLFHRNFKTLAQYEKEVFVVEASSIGAATAIAGIITLIFYFLHSWRFKRTSPSNSAS